jgi:predicted membrane metal-binding protein
MSIGNIELLDPETKSAFTQAGIIHILVVSGSNIAFVILIISKLLSYIPIRSMIKHMIIVSFVLLYGSLV